MTKEGRKEGTNEQTNKRTNGLDLDLGVDLSLVRSFGRVRLSLDFRVSSFGCWSFGRLVVGSFWSFAWFRLVGWWLVGWLVGWLVVGVLVCQCVALVFRGQLELFVLSIPPNANVCVSVGINTTVVGTTVTQVLHFRPLSCEDLSIVWHSSGRPVRQLLAGWVVTCHRHTETIEGLVGERGGLFCGRPLIRLLSSLNLGR